MRTRAPAVNAYALHYSLRIKAALPPVADYGPCDEKNGPVRVDGAASVSLAAAAVTEFGGVGGWRRRWRRRWRRLGINRECNEGRVSYVLSLSGARVSTLCTRPVRLAICFSMASMRSRRWSLRPEHCVSGSVVCVCVGVYTS